MRQRVDVRLPSELLARLDARAEELGQTRTKFVERAVEAALVGPRIHFVGASSPEHEDRLREKDGRALTGMSEVRKDQLAARAATGPSGRTPHPRAAAMGDLNKAKGM